MKHRTIHVLLENIVKGGKSPEEGLTSKPENVDPKERGGFWLEIGARGKEIMGFGCEFWALDPTPAATKIVLGHGTEIEAMLSLLSAKPNKDWCRKLMSFLFYWQKDWWRAEFCREMWRWDRRECACVCCGKSEKPK